ncbi:hypothetical protein [Mariniblastus fucicola]|uniref:Tetratricopeptide repeat protein n=1 Tax=Mariniblastus fucicola TaxID=980251 RepID=A0A5B9PEW4_9BACT|nr:hypothetical protein [Mariniblastus fucicola]QEG21443.1 Tetratricopeptide repeat protein [Mariniblastus fucicola]
MKRFLIPVVAIGLLATSLVPAETANAQLRSSISDIVSKVRPAPMPQQRSIPCSNGLPGYPPNVSPRPVQPPVYVQPPAYTQPPVYVQPQPIVYSQPRVHAATPVTYPMAATPTPAVSPADQAKSRAKQLANTAKQQFRDKQYDKAKATLDEVVKLVPNDSTGWQFRGLVSFSMGDFEAAAADMYDTLRLGNTWPRKSIDNLYGEHAADYSVQLSKLNENVAQTPSMQGHFLLAYHYMVNEQFEASRKELQNVLKLQPEEPLSMKLLKVIDQRLAQK